MVDSEDIIRAVKKQTAIWDLDNVGYHNKNLKDQAWNGVCEDLIPNWSKLSEGIQYIKQMELKKKWNNIRDYYKKLLSETRPGEQEVRAKKRRYLYSDILEFIRPVYDKKRVESFDSNLSAGDNAESDDQQDSETEADQLQTVAYPFRTVPKRQSINTDKTKPHRNQNETKIKKEEPMTVFERTIIKTLENKIGKDDDPDLLFLKSVA